MFRSLRPAGPLDRPQEARGAALEGLVAQHLRAWIDYSGAAAALTFWRTRAGSEVDFVLYGRDVFWALEVKHAARIRLGGSQVSEALRPGLSGSDSPGWPTSATNTCGSTAYCACR